MAETIKGFQTLQGEAQYDYGALANKPDIDGKISAALDQYKVNVDATLKKSGEAADAAATGEKIAQAINSANTYTDEQLQLYEVEVDKTLTQEDQAADAASTGAAIQLINNQMAEMPYFDEEGQDSGAILINADTLGGEPAKNFAKKSDISSLNDSIEEQLANDFLDKEYIQQNYATQAFVTNKIAEAQLEGENVDLSGLASIDLLNEKIDNLDYPVDSVNSKTGNIVLGAEDVGARPNTWMPTAEQVGARPDTWMPSASDVGAAPAGYGLGRDANHGMTPIADANTATRNGWYHINTATANTPGVNGVMRVDSYTEGSVMQTIFCTSWSASYHAMFQRVCLNGTWQEWDWVDPPMILGVEYRTTERWQGKAVYAVLLDFGAMPSNDSKTVGTGILATHVVSCELSLEDYDGFSYTNSPAIVYYRATASGAISMEIKTSDDYSNTTAYFLIKYIVD